MITLKEVLDHLTYGNLSHVSIGNAAMGFIEEKDYPKVISCINGALTALHKRFLLRTGEISIQQYADTTVYYLRRLYAVSNTGDPSITKYLIDTTDNPFPSNVFKIEKLYSADGSEIILNDDTMEYPAYTPNFDTLVMTLPETPELVRVTYRADHPRIVIGDTFDPELVELHIPYSILDAISLNVASRIYTPLTSGDGQQSSASAFIYAYEMECKRLEDEGITLDHNVTDNRFENSGWV